ncbi:hypothetical protein C8F01DRAFT_1094633 [Mycena amicta]|nr:hypothetical protein C8F01DRAFT_1094633 [Mycena amicta]
MLQTSALLSPPLPNATIHATLSPWTLEEPFTSSSNLTRPSWRRNSENPWWHQPWWAAQCKPQLQVWLYWWAVPFAAKFEKLIQKHFKNAGAWLGPSCCRYCRKQLIHSELLAKVGLPEVSEVEKPWSHQLVLKKENGRKILQQIVGDGP